MNNAAIIVGAVAVGTVAYVIATRPRTQTSAGDSQSMADYVLSFGDRTPTPDTPQEIQPGETSVYDVLASPMESIAQQIDRFSAGALHISKMSQVTPDLLQNSNVQAMLRVIRRGEGTSDENGYRRSFGGALFDSYADHPRTKYTRGAYTSSAAGAYQFLISTWDETARILGLPDFSPESQDLAAVARMVYRGALNDVIAGDLTAAMPKLGKEWASMPGSPYGQPVISMQTAINTYTDNGGQLA